ncbi:hypothetical protein BGZ94_000068 [Podila epigama]|nr:hypothetical protein BGZ94_000068 [Podila epigama]
MADPIIQICSATFGCPEVVKILAPCGGGATNSSLQQDLIYTPTPILGSCQCNSEFYNAFSSCLACIASQGKNSPAIQDQQGYVDNCKSYGFNFTQSPIPFTLPTHGDSAKGGLSGGAIAGIIIAIVAAAGLFGGWYFLKHRKSRTKASIFKRPYTSANSDAGDFAPAPTFNTSTSYHNANYPESQDNHHHDGYYDYNQDNMVLMDNINSNRNSTYIPPPVPMSAYAVSAVSNLRPGDAFPQTLRSKPLRWEEHPPELTSGLVAADHLKYNDKAVYEDEDEDGNEVVSGVLEPPRARDRFMNDRDDYTNRRSLTPPRANMQSYKDDFSRPSFEREPRHSGSERGSITGLNLGRSGTPVGSSGGYGSGQEGASGPIDDSDRFSPVNLQESPESVRRRERAAELFAAERTRP